MLEAVRKACLPAIWSQGVKLAREGSVSLVKREASEAVFRVRAPGHAVAPTVTLYLDDEEWSCDCNGKVDPCAHVAAAAIATSQAGEEGLPVAGGQSPATGSIAAGAHVGYRLAARDGRLTLNRVIV